MSTKKKKTKAIFEDGDDAHFDGNPAFKGHNKKRVGGIKQSGAIHLKPKTRKKSTRKRVAGK